MVPNPTPCGIDNYGLKCIKPTANLQGRRWLVPSFALGEMPRVDGSGCGTRTPDVKLRR